MPLTENSSGPPPRWGPLEFVRHPGYKGLVCGRYSLASDEFSQIQIQFRVDAKFELSSRYNIAPTWAPGYEPPLIFQPRGAAPELSSARWWMIPSSWKRPLNALPTAFNARAEELGYKPFWSPSFDTRRCLVPATGWREFRGPSGQRRAFQFHHDHGLFAFAGVWDRWSSAEGEQVQSFAIVTVAANDMVQPIHDRMPLCVDPAYYSEWLDPEVPGVRALTSARRSSGAGLAYYEADPCGNDSRREGPECIAPRRVQQLGLFG